ncbi:MAG: hypothetical protein KJO12_04680, partial [Ignavibacteria bacterium]|nr:hypothetical protein [Ignavibacteria bacterium]
SRLKKIFWITVAWTFISVYYVLIVYSNLIYLERDVSDIELWIYIQGSIMTALVAGIIAGSLVVFF